VSSINFLDQLSSLKVIPFRPFGCLSWKILCRDENPPIRGHFDPKTLVTKTVL
jgi:hypothetical protein